MTMEHWIGILLVLGMIPGLILIVGVVVAAVIKLKRRPDQTDNPADSTTQIVQLPSDESRR